MATCSTFCWPPGQSVKTTERGGTRGLDGYKRVKGRKRHILVDMQGLSIANRVEPASISDRRAATRLLSGLSPLFPKIHTVIADAGHQSRNPRITPGEPLEATDHEVRARIRACNRFASSSSNAPITS